MTEREEQLEALREAAELKARAKAERDARIRRIAVEGLSLGEIAKRMGVSPSVVSRVMGGTVPRRPGHRGLPDGLPSC